MTVDLRLGQPSNDLGGDFQDQYAHAGHTPESMGGRAPQTQPAPGIVDAGRRPPGQSISEAAADRLRNQSMANPRKLRDAGTLAAGTAPLIIALDTCPLGFIWHLRQLHVGPADYLAFPYTPPSQVVAFTRGGPPGAVASGATAPGGVSADNVLSLTSAFPAQGSWSDFEAIIQPGETLFVAIIGAVVGTTYTVGATVKETAANTPLIRSLG